MISAAEQRFFGLLAALVSYTCVNLNRNERSKIIDPSGGQHVYGGRASVTHCLFRFANGQEMVERRIRSAVDVVVTSRAVKL